MFRGFRAGPHARERDRAHDGTCAGVRRGANQQVECDADRGAAVPGATGK